MPEQHDLDALEQTLRGIRASWTARLPERLAEIGQALQQYTAAPHDQTGGELLLGRLHGLSGSAGSFGHGELGQRATDLEIRLGDQLRDGAIQDLPQLAADVSAMLSWAATLLEPAPGATEPVASRPAPAAPRDRTVYLVQDHDETEVATQLRHFGYQVEVIGALSALQPAIKAQQAQVILVDLAFPDGIMAGAAELTRIRQQEDDSFAAIFLSTRSSFDARLATVRAGADSYFSKPLDTVALVGRLETLINSRQEAPYRILMVDDDPDAADFHAAVLRAADMEVKVLHRAAEVPEALSDYRPELVLLDVYMPECDGTELARLIRQDDRYLDVPIVFLSSESDLGKQLGAMAAGGDDFLTKPIKPAHLVSALTSRVHRYRVLRSLITRDSMTGLLNHSALKEQLTREVARAARSGAPLSVGMIDIDRFKQVNDSWGHPVGDQVIRALARLLQQRLRRTDIIGRYGGEEFAVIMPATDRESAATVVDGIRQSFAELVHHAERQDFHCSFSGGVSSTGSGGSAEDLLQRADAALYSAKRRGRDRVVAG